MAIESDNDRASFLLDDGIEVQINGVPVRALPETEPLDVQFEIARVRTSDMNLYVLTSVLRRHGIKKDDPVEVPDQGTFVVSEPPTHRSGLSQLALERA